MITPGPHSHMNNANRKLWKEELTESWYCIEIYFTAVNGKEKRELIIYFIKTAVHEKEKIY